MLFDEVEDKKTVLGESLGKELLKFLVLDLLSKYIERYLHKELLLFVVEEIEQPEWFLFRTQP